MNSKAFTLIELLVVIAIIAILASLLLPAVERAQDMAKLVGCVSNQRSIAIAVQQYANANDGFIVPCASAYYPPPGSGKSPFPLWYDRLNKGGFIEVTAQPAGDTISMGAVTDQPHVLHCPADSDSNAYSSYSANQHSMGYIDTQGLPDYFKRRWRVRRAEDMDYSASEVILIGDRGGNQIIGSSDYSATSVFWWSGSNRDGTGFNWRRHGADFEITATGVTGAKGCVALVDGHAETISCAFDATLPGTDVRYGAPPSVSVRMGADK